MLTMKTTTASVFLLFIFTVTQSSYLFGVTNATNSPVLDLDGDEVLTGVPYHVVSAIWGAGGGGLALGRPSGNPCPESVIQRMSDLDDGIPVIFSNMDPNDHVVRLSTDVNIKFVPFRPKFCMTSTVWRVDDYDDSTGKRWLTTDGVIGNPGPNTIANWFKIEKPGEFGYKFKYCPTLCESCKPLVCSDVGKDVDPSGDVRLVLSDQAWPWIFKKAKRTAWGRLHQVVNA